MKVNSPNTVDPQFEALKRPSQGAIGGPQDPGSSPPGSASGAVARSAGPAASVQIDPAAQKAARQAVQGLAETSDTALLDEIRAKINAGEFEINYDRVAESILGNAIAASRAKILNP